MIFPLCRSSKMWWTELTAFTLFKTAFQFDARNYNLPLYVCFCSNCFFLHEWPFSPCQHSTYSTSDVTLLPALFSILTRSFAFSLSWFQHFTPKHIHLCHRWHINLVDGIYKCFSVYLKYCQRQSLRNYWNNWSNWNNLGNPKNSELILYIAHVNMWFNLYFYS